MASPGNSLGFQPGFLHFSLSMGLGLSYWNGEERRINIATNGAKQGFKGRYGGLYGAKLLKAKGDGCSLRLSPVLPVEPFYARELRDIRCHQSELPAQRLPRHEKVVGADGFAGGFEDCSHPAGNAGIGIFERENENRAGEEGFEALAIEVVARALGDP